MWIICQNGNLLNLANGNIICIKRWCDDFRLVFISGKNEVCIYQSGSEKEIKKFFDHFKERLIANGVLIDVFKGYEKEKRIENIPDAIAKALKEREKW